MYRIRAQFDKTDEMEDIVTLEASPPLELHHLYEIATQLFIISGVDTENTSYLSPRVLPLSSMVKISVQKEDGLNLEYKFQEAEPSIREFLSPTGLVDVVFVDGKE